MKNYVFINVFTEMYFKEMWFVCFEGLDLFFFSFILNQFQSLRGLGEP